MNSLDSNKYIPLKTAAELYGYTRDHLGLMIRQRKLQGIKLGSYYVTTNEWMVEYIKKYANPNYPINKAKLSNKFLAAAINSRPSGKIILKKKTMPKISVSKDPEKKSETDLQKKVLEELSHLGVGVPNGSQKADKAPERSPVPSFLENSYVILPIRKMENFERDQILDRTLENGEDSDYKTA